RLPRGLLGQRFLRLPRLLFDLSGGLLGGQSLRLDPLRLLALGSLLKPGLRRGEDLLGSLRPDPRHTREALDTRREDGVEALEAVLLQSLHGLLAHARKIGHLAPAPGPALHLGLDLALLLLLALDVDFPSGQAGGETNVLALLADCQRQLLVVHHDLERRAL